MLAKIGKKILIDNFLNFFPGNYSPATLYFVAVINIMFCFKMLVSANSDTSMPELSGFPDITNQQFRPPSFQSKAFFYHALVEYSPNFREKS